MTDLEATQIVDPNRPKSTETVIREWRAKQKDLEARFGRNWNRPVIPLVVEEDYDNAIFDGQSWRPGLHVTYGEYDYGRLREGRVCLECMNPLEEAFPETCNLCGFGVRDNQAARLETEFQGYKHVGPTTSYNEEFEMLAHKGAKKRHVPGSQILVPDTPPSGIILPPGARVDSPS